MDEDYISDDLGDGSWIHTKDPEERSLPEDEDERPKIYRKAAPCNKREAAPASSAAAAAPHPREVYDAIAPDVTFTFGRYRGRKFYDIATTDVHYVFWGFPGPAKAHPRRLRLQPPGPDD